MGRTGRGLTDLRFVLFGRVWQGPHLVPIGLTIHSGNPHQHKLLEPASPR